MLTKSIYLIGCVVGLLQMVYCYCNNTTYINIFVVLTVVPKAMRIEHIEMNEIKHVPHGKSHDSPVNIWYDLKQIATEFFSTGMHSGEVSL